MLSGASNGDTTVGLSRPRCKGESGGVIASGEDSTEEKEGYRSWLGVVGELGVVARGIYSPRDVSWRTQLLLCK